ncbi:aspartate carbamoyltransferase regulatory subunit [Litoribacillus peritrichatus]|uniref:Aspartate carbamoyltransferase regulatory chain n=1 Tax=Litoribacillus peritrichatus TaxID=718191 RepID=A0ABP7MP95_9GAMM
MTEKMQVEAIQQGTVIDHIPAGQGIRILKRLHLEAAGNRITVGLNLPSKDMSLKDLIKVEGRMFTEDEAHQLALFAPEGTINVIDDYEVVNKFAMRLPETLEGVFSCPNSNCISLNEPVKSFFYIQPTATQVKMKCKYCEKSFNKEVVVAS